MADDDWELDAVLLERWRTGDRKAGAMLYRRHAHVVIRFFRTKLSADQVEDRVQETFTRLIEARERIRDGQACRAYILRIAQNVMCEHWRSFEPDRVIDLSIDSIEGLTPGLTTQFGHKRQQHMLLAALRSLPIEHQIRLELHYVEGISIVEIADFEQTSPSTMRSRMSRSRELLTLAIARLDESTALINSTVDALDEWARDMRALDGGDGDDGDPGTR